MKRNKTIINNGVVLKREIDSDFSKSDNGYYGLLRIALIMLSSICSVCAYTSAMNTKINLTSLICFDIFATLLFCSYKIKSIKARIISGVITSGVCLFFILKINDIIMGFQHLANDYMIATEADAIFTDVTIANKEYFTSLAFTLLLFLIIGGLSVTLFYRFSFIGTVCITLPCLELVLFWGFVPDYFTFFVLLCCWFTALCSQNCIGSKVRYLKGNKYLPKTNNNVFYSASEKQLFSSGSIVSVFVAVLSVIVLIISILVSFFVNERPDSIDNTRSSIKNALENFKVEDIPLYVEDILGNFSTNSNFGKTTGVGSGELGKEGKIKFKDKVMLEIEMTNLFTADVLYLKGISSGVYKNNSWRQLDNKAYKKYDFIFEDSDYNLYNFQDYSSVMQPYSHLATNGPKQISIIDHTDSTCLFMPYSADFATIEDAYTIKDSYLKTSYDSYVFKFENHMYSSSSVPNYQLFTTPMVLDDFIDYQDFVEENYLDFETISIRKTYNDIVSTLIDDVNREGYYSDLYLNLSYNYSTSYLENLLSGYDSHYDCDDDGFIDFHKYHVNSIDSLIAVSSMIQTYFDENYEYTLEPGKTPFGKDFVQYFLEEQKEGYCTYFASAGTLLMRAFGFPARYVEGFVAPKSEFSSIVDGSDTYYAKITDKYAHAWCEVFITDLGWVPVEFTPSYDNGMIGYEDPTITTTTKKETTTTTTTTKFETQSPDEIKKPTPDNNKENQTAISDVDNENNGGDKADYNKIVKTIVGIVSAVVGVILLLYIWKLIYENKRRKHDELVSNSVRNYAVTEIYKYLMKIFNAVGIVIDNHKTDIQDTGSIFNQLSKFNITVNAEDFEKFTTLAVEADMSRNVVTEESYEFASELYKKLSTEIYTSISPIRKMILKYFRFLY